MNAVTSASIIGTTDIILESIKEKERLSYEEFMTYKAYMEVLKHCGMDGNITASRKMIELGRTLITKKIERSYLPSKQITRIKSDIRNSVY